MNAIAKIKASEPGMTKTVMIALNQLVPSLLNPRRNGDTEEDITSLATSIAEQGQIQNLVVRTDKSSTAKKPVYEVYVGGRRLKALRQNCDKGLITETHLVPCNIVEADDRTAFIIAMTENINRKDMTPLDECDAYARAIAEGSSVAAVARTVGRSAREVTDGLAVAKLPEWGKSLVGSGSRTISWGAALSRLSAQNIAKVEAEIANNPLAYATSGHINQLARAGRIAVTTAIFDNAQAQLATTGDLFDGEIYFEDSQAFWTRQNEAIEAKVAELEQAGHARVEVLRGQTFSDFDWEHVDSPLDATAFIVVAPDGHVEIHDCLRSKSAPTANELDDADSAIFAANEAIGAAGEDGEESDTPDTITYTPPKKNAAAKMLARIHLDAVAARVLKDASLARRLELAAALGDKRLGAAPMPAAIKAPALSEASYAVEAARSVFNDAQEAAKPDPLAYAMKLTEEEVAALATIITALRLPHQRGDQVHFPDAGVLMTLAATHGVNFREGFTPNEAFFAPFDLADLRKLAIELSDAKEMRTIQTSSRRDLIRNLSRHFAEAAETPDSLDPVTLAFNDWTPKYF